MTQKADSTSNEQPVLPDGGETDPTSGVTHANESSSDAATVHQNTNYLEAEVNILRPSTPFMRDHLRLIWIGFIAWALIIFGPVTATYFAPGTMTETTFIGFPLHYFLVAIGGPGGALLLSVVYSWRRDKLDRKYGIDHETGAATKPQESAETSDVAADGGEHTAQTASSGGDSQ